MSGDGFAQGAVDQTSASVTAFSRRIARQPSNRVRTMAFRDGFTRSMCRMCASTTSAEVGSRRRILAASSEPDKSSRSFMGAVTRHLNNDTDALHERMLLDVAGTIAWLRTHGFRRVVLLGNSGGGSLFAFYLEQAAKPPAARHA